MEREKQIRNERILEAAAGVLLLTVLFVWGYVQPIYNQPDERCRYLIPYYIFTYGKLPTGNELEVIISTYGISYAFFPGLPYIVMAVFMKVASFFTASSFVLLMSARLVNMLAGVISYIFIRRTAKKLFSHKQTAWFFTLTAAFWPQVLFIFTYVNCDAFAYMSCTIMVYALVSGLKEGWGKRNATAGNDRKTEQQEETDRGLPHEVTLAIGVSVCALSYYNAYGMILGSVIVFAFSFFYQKDQMDGGRRKYGFYIRECMLTGLRIVGIVGILAGWWFVRNALLHDGDFLGFESNRQLAEIYGATWYKPSQKVTLQNSGHSLLELLNNAEFAFLLKQSFFARFGNMDILVQNYIIRGFKIIVFVGSLGLLLPNRHRTFVKEKRAGFAAGMLVSFATAVALTYWYSYTSDYQPQGRYLLPGLVPLLAITFTGIQNITYLLEKWINTVGIRVLYACIYGYLLLSTLGCVKIIYTQYYDQIESTVNMIFRGGPL